MVDRALIDKWLEDGTIAGEQAEKMLADIARFKEERKSNRMVGALSTLGAVFLGVGVILLVASNWKKSPTWSGCSCWS
jgi:uncharacterized membrane protein